MSTTSRHLFDNADQAEWFALGVEWADPGLLVASSNLRPTEVRVTDPEQSDEDYEVDHRDDAQGSPVMRGDNAGCFECGGIRRHERRCKWNLQKCEHMIPANECRVVGCRGSKQGA